LMRNWHLMSKNIKIITSPEHQDNNYPQAEM
jgi:hypothetical protein